MSVWKANIRKLNFDLVLTRPPWTDIDEIKDLAASVFPANGLLLNPQHLLDAGVISQAQFDSLESPEWETTEQASTEESLANWLGEHKILSIHQSDKYPEYEDEEVDEDVGDESKVDLNRTKVSSVPNVA